MNDKELSDLFDLIAAHYKKHLQEFGVRPANLKDSNGNYAKDALVLIYLAQGYPNAKAVSKA